MDFFGNNNEPTNLGNPDPADGITSCSGGLPEAFSFSNNVLNDDNSKQCFKEEFVSNKKELGNDHLCNCKPSGKGQQWMYDQMLTPEDQELIQEKKKKIAARQLRRNFLSTMDMINSLEDLIGKGVFDAQEVMRNIPSCSLDEIFNSIHSIKKRDCPDSEVFDENLKAIFGSSDPDAAKKAMREDLAKTYLNQNNDANNCIPPRLDKKARFGYLEFMGGLYRDFNYTEAYKNFDKPREYHFIRSLEDRGIVYLDKDKRRQKVQGYENFRSLSAAEQKEVRDRFNESGKRLGRFFQLRNANRYSGNIFAVMLNQDKKIKKRATAIFDNIDCVRENGGIKKFKKKIAYHCKDELDQAYKDLMKDEKIKKHIFGTINKRCESAFSPEDPKQKRFLCEGQTPKFSMINTREMLVPELAGKLSIEKLRVAAITEAAEITCQERTGLYEHSDGFNEAISIEKARVPEKEVLSIDADGFNQKKNLLTSYKERNKLVCQDILANFCKDKKNCDSNPEISSAIKNYIKNYFKNEVGLTPEEFKILEDKGVFEDMDKMKFIMSSRFAKNGLLDIPTEIITKMGKNQKYISSEIRYLASLAKNIEDTPAGTNGATVLASSEREIPESGSVIDYVANSTQEDVRRMKEGVDENGEPFVFKSKGFEDIAETESNFDFNRRPPAPLPTKPESPTPVDRVADSPRREDSTSISESRPTRSNGGNQRQITIDPIINNQTNVRDSITTVGQPTINNTNNNEQRTVPVNNPVTQNQVIQPTSPVINNPVQNTDINQPKIPETLSNIPKPITSPDTSEITGSGQRSERVRAAGVGNNTSVNSQQGQTRQNSGPSADAFRKLQDKLASAERRISSFENSPAQKEVIHERVLSGGLDNSNKNKDGGDPSKVSAIKNSIASKFIDELKKGSRKMTLNLSAFNKKDLGIIPGLRSKNFNFEFNKIIPEVLFQRVPLVGVIMSLGIEGKSFTVIRQEEKHVVLSVYVFGVEDDIDWKKYNSRQNFASLTNINEEYQKRIKETKSSSVKKIMSYRFGQGTRLIYSKKVELNTSNETILNTIYDRLLSDKDINHVESWYKENESYIKNNNNTYFINRKLTSSEK